MAIEKQFLAFGTQDLYEANKSNMKETSIAFVEEAGNEKIAAQGKEYQFIPSGSRDGQTLMSQGGKGVWVDIDMLDTLSYGVEWKPNVSDPALTRVGNMSYHKTLPIQSGMKGCIYNSKEKRVVYWLDEDNWTYKKGGNPDKGETEQLARLDGYDGEVMVYVPEFYIKSWDEADRRCVRISSINIDGTWEHQPAVYLAAYRDTVLNTVPPNMGYLSTLPVNTAISVANSNTYCRGGLNDSTYDNVDDIFRRDLGKCRTGLSRSTFRTYARRAGKEIMSYRQYKNIMYWLWVIEYANFNSQATYNPELTSEGFKQGGMGLGLTTMQYGTQYNDNTAVTPNGYTNEFGNGTGVKDLVIPEFTYGTDNTVVATQTLKATRWRGFENSFGDLVYNVDGILVEVKDGKGYVYTTDDPSKYGDTSANIANMVLSGIEVHRTGYIKEWDLGSTAEIIPRTVGGTSTQYKCDQDFIGSDRGGQLRAVFVGADYGANFEGGIGRISTSSSVSGSYLGVSVRTVIVA